jgi:ribonucleoside-diphosphate reductase alpha chain
VVARRCFACEPGGAPERSVRRLVDRVLGAIASWAQAAGQVADAEGGDAHRLGQIGIGYANLAALLLSLGLPCDSDEGRSWAAAITALMIGVAYRRSAELAATLGPFAEFERNREPMLQVIARHVETLARLGSEQPEDVLRAARREWTRALELGHKHGFRNAQTTLVPPTGTVSLMLDCETTGIEPYYALTTIKHFVDGGQVKLSSRAVVDGLGALRHTTSTIETLSEYALDYGHLADGPGLRDDERLVFQTASGAGALSPIAHLQMVAAVQPFLSGGVSKTSR